MVNPFIWLLLLCITMLVGSFLAGCIPLSSKLSDAKLRHLTALGVGLLIGTALVVIIPEGIETLYSSTKIRTSSSSLIHSGGSSSLHDEVVQNFSAHLLPSSTQPVWVAAAEEQTPASIHKRQEPHQNKSDVHNDHDDGEESSEHTAIGLALIIGFAVMFTIDQISSLHVHACSRSDSEISLRDQSSFPYTSTPSSNPEQNDLQQRAYYSRASTRSMTPTIGLIVHAAADGIALGASASQPKLSMVVFLAIMLHKAPSAFALTTVLLAEGLSRLSVRRHLLVFSLSAPTGAITTYLLLYVFSSTSSSSAHLAYWTGFLLIFSGGTFLYVAMHALQELQPSYPSPSSLAHPDKLSASQRAAILTGMFLPVLLNIGHSH